MNTSFAVYPRNVPAMVAGGVGIGLVGAALAWWTTAPVRDTSLAVLLSLVVIATVAEAGLVFAGTGARKRSLVLGTATVAGAAGLGLALLFANGQLTLPVALVTGTLVLAGLVLVGASVRPWPLRSAAVGLLGSVLAGVGIGWLVARLAGTGTGIHGTTPIVATAAVTLAAVAFGLGSIAVAWRDDEIQNHLGPVWLPPVLGIGVMTISVLEWSALAAAHPALPALSLALGVLVSLLLTLFVWFVHRQRETTIEVERINEALIEHLAERRRVEDALVHAKEQAEAANLAKSRFLATMSHELRTPLNSVVGFTNVLRKNKQGNFEDKDLGYLNRIADNAGHLLEIIDGILDLARIEADRLDLVEEPVYLERLVPKVLEQLEGEVGTRPIALLTDIPSGLRPIVADAGRLRQVLINLLGNALKFTDEGSVTVRVRADADDRPTSIAVIDTGIGIQAERLGLIFEPFQQGDDSTERKYGGTGLGLAISRTLVQAMGHRIEVDSTVGMGSTFTIRFADPVSP